MSELNPKAGFEIVWDANCATGARCCGSASLANARRSGRSGRARHQRIKPSHCWC